MKENNKNNIPPKYAAGQDVDLKEKGHTKKTKPSLESSPFLDDIVMVPEDPKAYIELKEANATRRAVDNKQVSADAAKDKLRDKVFPEVLKERLNPNDKDADLLIDDPAYAGDSDIINNQDSSLGAAETVQDTPIVELRKQASEQKQKQQQSIQQTQEAQVALQPQVQAKPLDSEQVNTPQTHEIQVEQPQPQIATSQQAPQQQQQQNQSNPQASLSTPVWSTQEAPAQLHASVQASHSLTPSSPQQPEKLPEKPGKFTGDLHPPKE